MLFFQNSQNLTIFSKKCIQLVVQVRNDSFCLNTVTVTGDSETAFNFAVYSHNPISLTDFQLW